jgi:hypothetical protein
MDSQDPKDVNLMPANLEQTPDPQGAPEAKPPPENLTQTSGSTETKAARLTPEKLLEAIQKANTPGLPETAQEELAHLTNLLPSICEADQTLNPQICQQIEIILGSLQTNQPNLKLALMVREAIVARCDQARTRARLAPLKYALKNVLAKESNETNQNELVQFIQLLSEIGNDESFAEELELASQALQKSNPDVSFVSKQRASIQDRLKERKSLLKGTSPTSQVILGVLAFLKLVGLVFLVPLCVGLLAFIGGNLITYFPSLEDFFWDAQGVFDFFSSIWDRIPLPLRLAAFSGAVGGIASLMVRMPDFARLRASSYAVLFSTGFFRPFIGMILATFVAAIFNSGLFGVTIEGGKKEIFFYLILGFICGFSEIVAKDILSKAEQAVGSLAKRKQA